MKRLFLFFLILVGVIWLAGCAPAQPTATVAATAAPQIVIPTPVRKPGLVIWQQVIAAHPDDDIKVVSVNLASGNTAELSVSSENVTLPVTFRNVNFGMSHLVDGSIITSYDVMMGVFNNALPGVYKFDLTITIKSNDGKPSNNGVTTPMEVTIQ